MTAAGQPSVAGTAVGAGGTLLQRLRLSPTWVATLLAALTVLGPLSMDLYLPVLPGLADDLGSGASSVQLTLTACLLGLAFGQVVAGPLSDRYGRRRPLLVGLVIYTLASLLCAASPTIGALVAARLLQGLAGGVGLVIAQAVGRDVYRGARLTRYYGRIVVLSGVAAIVAPVIGGALSSVTTWRGLFVVLAGVGVVVTFAVLLGFRETLPAASRTPPGWRETVGHLVVLGRDRIFVGATVASALTSAAYFAYLAGAPFVLQVVHGLTPPQFALVFAGNAAGFAAAGFLAGRAAERRGERRVLAAGLLVVGAGGLTLLAASTAELSVAAAVTGFSLVAVGAAVVSPPATTIALVGHPQRAGTASSLVGMTRFAAGGIAAPLAGLGGQDSLGPTSAVVLVTCLAAAVTCWWFLRGAAPALTP